MVKIHFWNVLTNKPGCICIEELICKRCKRQIKRKFHKQSDSFDFYHPFCFKKKHESTVIVVDDPIGE